jgi:hypothetical protein
VDTLQESVAAQDPLLSPAGPYNGGIVSCTELKYRAGVADVAGGGAEVGHRAAYTFDQFIFAIHILFFRPVAAKGLNWYIRVQSRLGITECSFGEASISGSSRKWNMG